MHVGVEFLKLALHKYLIMLKHNIIKELHFVKIKEKILHPIYIYIYIYHPPVFVFEDIGLPKGYFFGPT